MSNQISLFIPKNDKLTITSKCSYYSKEPMGHTGSKNYGVNYCRDHRDKAILDLNLWVI